MTDRLFNFAHDLIVYGVVAIAIYAGLTNVATAIGKVQLYQNAGPSLNGSTFYFSADADKALLGDKAGLIYISTVTKDPCRDKCETKP
jgi:hypothetical protein